MSVDASVLARFRHFINGLILTLFFKIGRLRGGTTKSVMFFPEVPDRRYMIWKVLRALGIAPSGYSPWRRRALAVAFADSTYAQIDVRAYLSRRRRDARRVILNEGCTDISKSRVSGAFYRVFGYSLEVDPVTYSGQAVKKSEFNAAHDGEVLECPIPVEQVAADCHYSVLINNEVEGGLVEDMRAVVMGSTIPLVYRKRRSLSQRFQNTNVSARIVEPDSLLSPKEIGLLLQFAQEMGLDIGELDVLRDVDSQRIYVVDVSNTPAGPPGGIGVLGYYRSIFRLARAFKLAFLTDPAEPA